MVSTNKFESNKNLAIAIPLAIFLLNLILKSIFLGANEVALDEPFTIFNAQRPVGELVEYLKKYNNPPLFDVFLHYWVGWFGVGAVAVRIPSLVFSCLTSVVIYKIGKDVWDRMTGTLAALIFTFSTFNIYFSHEARAYALFGLLTCLSMYFFVRWVREGESRKLLVFYSLSSITLIYTHYFGFFVLLSQGIWFLVFLGKEKKHWIGFGLSMLIAGLVFLPQFVVMLNRFGDASGKHWVDKSSVKSLYDGIIHICNRIEVAVAFMLFLLVAGIFYLRRRKEQFRRIDALFILWFPAVYVLPWLIGFKIPMFLDRYMVFVSPAVYLLLAAGAVAVFEGRVRLILGGVLLLSMVATSNVNPKHDRDWKGIVSLVEQEKDEGTAVLFLPRWIDLGFVYHYNQEYFSAVDEMHDKMRAEDFYTISDSTDKDLLMLDQFDKIVLIELGSRLVDPKAEIPARIKMQFPNAKKLDEAFKPVEMTVYTK